MTCSGGLIGTQHAEVQGPRDSREDRERQRLHALIHAIDKGLIVLDRHGQVALANPAARRIHKALGRGSRSLRTEPCRPEVRHPGERFVLCHDISEHRRREACEDQQERLAAQEKTAAAAHELNGLAAVEKVERPAVALALHRAGDTFSITPADNGPGVSAEPGEQIFEPFFTTKTPGRGTDLGLPTARRVFESHGDTLSLLPVSGVGAIFEIRLLALESVTVPDPTPSHPTEDNL